MKITRLAIIILAQYLVAFPTFLIGADFTNNDIALKEYDKLTTVVEKNFQKTADTLVAIVDLDRQTPNWKAIRALKTKLWLQLLDQIDYARDLDFDFNDPQNGYTINVAPPGFRYNSGIEPSVIKEPEIRLEYEEAIRENRAKAKRIDFERRLKQQDEKLTTVAVQYLNSAYEKAPDDAEELNGYLSRINNPKHNAEIRAKLQELLKFATRPGS